MESFACSVGVVTALVTMRFLYRLMFEGSDDLCECIAASFTPGIISLFRGTFGVDFSRSFRLSFFLSIVLLSGVLGFHSALTVGNWILPT